MSYAEVQSPISRSLYYEDTGGSGPVVVFSHGFLMDHEMFQPQIEALSADYRCITWDQRGHGLTATDRLSPFDFYDSANDLTGLLDDLQIDRAVLVGMSQGGFLTLRCALSNPDVVRGLVLLDTEAGLMPANEVGANKGMLAVWEQGFSAALGSAIANEIIGPGDGQPLWPGASDWIAKWGQTRFVNLIPCFNALINRDDVTDALGALKFPALVVHGEDDQSIPLAAGQALAAGIPGSQFVEVAGAGHAACLTYADVVTPHIQGFLAGLPA